MSENSEQDLADKYSKMVSLAILTRFIRAHLDTPWPEIVSTSLDGGYTPSDINFARWFVGVEIINRKEEEDLHVHAQRN